MNRNPSPLRPSLALVLLCFLLAPAPGFAQDEDDDQDDESFGRAGWYLAVSGVGIFTNYRDTAAPVDNSAGLGARVGYRVSPRTALEAEFEWVYDFNEDLGTSTIRYRSYAVGLNGKFYLMDRAIQPYVVGGVNVLIVSESIPGNKTRNSDWGFRGGLGADYYITPHIALNAEVTYMWGVGDVWQRDYVSLGGGLTYRF